MATFQMPSHFLESRNKYIGGRIKRNLQNQEICYLYSQEGTRFQMSKIVFMQTERLRDILSSTLCCNGRCTGNFNPPEFFFPDISAAQLETLIKFFYTGVLQCSLSNYTTVVGLLTNIFGFPTSMSLDSFTETQDEFLRTEGRDKYSCRICQESLNSSNQIFTHIKNHLDQQYNQNLESFIQNQICSPCRFCAKNEFEQYKNNTCTRCRCIRCKSNNDATEQNIDTVKDAIKTHYDSHLQQLKNYMSKQFNWYENNDHAKSSIEVIDIDISFEANEKEFAYSSSVLTPIVRESTGNDHSGSYSPDTTINQNSSKPEAAQDLSLDNCNVTSYEDFTSKISTKPTSNSKECLMTPDTSIKQDTEVPFITKRSRNKSSNQPGEECVRSNPALLPHDKLRNVVKINRKCNTLQNTYSSFDSHATGDKKNNDTIIDNTASNRKKQKLDSSSYTPLPTDIIKEIDATKENIDKTPNEERIELTDDNKKVSYPEFNQEYSPVSSDTFSDDEVNESKRNSTEGSSLNQLAQQMYPEIDTEADTDNEAVT